MVLSDRSIKEELAKGRIVIEPLGEGCIQPASVDVHLDRKVLAFRNSRRPYGSCAQRRPPQDQLSSAARPKPTTANSVPAMIGRMKWLILAVIVATFSLRRRTLSDTSVSDCVSIVRR